AREDGAAQQRDSPGHRGKRGGGLPARHAEPAAVSGSLGHSNGAVSRVFDAARGASPRARHRDVWCPALSLRSGRLTRAATRSGPPGSPPCNRPTSMDPASLYGFPNALASHYSRFRVSERLLLTGHSHQAWPDCGFDGQMEAWLDAARYVDDKWEHALAKAERVREGFARLLGDAGGGIALAASTH